MARSTRVPGGMSRKRPLPATARESRRPPDPTYRRSPRTAYCPIDGDRFHTRKPGQPERVILEAGIPQGTRAETLVAAIAHEDEPVFVRRIVSEIVSLSGHCIERVNFRFQVMLAVQSEHACNNRMTIEVLPREIVVIGVHPTVKCRPLVGGKAFGCLIGIKFHM